MILFKQKAIQFLIILNNNIEILLPKYPKYTDNLTSLYINGPRLEKLNLSSGVPTNRASLNQLAQLQRLSRKLKFRVWLVLMLYCPISMIIYNKGADQAARMRRQVCALVRKPRRRVEAQIHHTLMRYFLLVWFCAVYRCPIKMTLGLYGFFNQQAHFVKV